ncbi:hypothetical protein [Cohnella soli]|uniref:Uncharacterized protein n=1 Tax=Cohnella soli TaxID=425005 RepID=A0ABW0HTN7_9BACL
MSEEFAKYEQLVREQDELFLKIETYQEVIASLQMLLHRHGASGLHLLTIEEILTTIHSSEMNFRTELLKMQTAKLLLSNKISYKSFFGGKNERY